jgi:hypothetical protein
MKTFTAGGIEYKTRLVTIDDLDIDEIFVNGEVNKRMLIEAAVTHMDGTPVDLSAIPVMHSVQMLRPAMEACGFVLDGADGGNGG